MPFEKKPAPVPAEQAAQIIIPPISPRRQKRIIEVQNLRNSGWTMEEIALRYGLNVRQIYRDLDDAKFYNRFLVSSLDADNIVGREIQLLEQSRRKEMRRYETSKNPITAAAHMRNAIIIHEKIIKLLQEYGLMEKAPDRLALEMDNPFDDPEFKAKYKALLIEAREKGIKIKGL